MVWNDPRKAAAAGAAAPAPAASAAPPPPTAAASAPAALPAVGTPPPPQPAATTAPPAATGRGRRGAAAATQAALAASTTAQPAAALTPPAATAATVTQQATRLPTAPQGFLALLAPQPGVRHGLQVVKEGVRPPGEPNVFPTIYITGGDTGGSFEYDSMNVEGSNAELPFGRGQGDKGNEPFHGIVIGYRYILLVWPKAYDKKLKQVPSARGILPWNENDAINLVQDAVQHYAFRNRQNQDQYDSVGHPNLTLEVLLYDDHAGLFCVRTTGTYESLLATGEELLAAFPDGVPQPTPVTFIPAQKQVESKTNTWDEHYLQVRQCAVGAEIDRVKAAFNGFIAANGQDAGLNKAIMDWGTFSVPAHVMQNLQTIATMPR